MSSSDFVARRARQLMNGGVPVAPTDPLVVAAQPSQVYGVMRGSENSVIYQFGDVRFVLCRDDAIKLGMLSLKYAGCDVDYGGEGDGEEPAG